MFTRFALDAFSKRPVRRGGKPEKGLAQKFLRKRFKVSRFTGKLGEIRVQTAARSTGGFDSVQRTPRNRSAARLSVTGFAVSESDLQRQFLGVRSKANGY